MATMKLVHFEPLRNVNIDDVERFAFVVLVPLTSTVVYLLAAFSYGFSGDIAARESIYPARMLALPVTTSSLVGWPMLYGSIAMMILWTATRLFAVWPPEFRVPIVWPALLAAALLAWTQALMWMPYGLPGLRVIVAVFWLAGIDAAAMLALHFNAHERTMAAFLAPQVPLAFLVARDAVARARRSDVPDWRGVFARAAERTSIFSAEKRNFSSAATAQAWFERQRHGRSLPALVSIVVPFELALLLIPSLHKPNLVFEILFCVLITPPFMAAFVAATVRKSNPNATDAFSLSPFTAARPVSSAALIAAKLSATIWSTLVTWALMFMFLAFGVELTGTRTVIVEQLGHFAETVGTPRAIVFVVLLFAGLMASTWKQLVQSLFIGLSGREWMVRTSVFVTLAILAGAGPLTQWIVSSSGLRLALWLALPWTLGALACIKIFAGGWMAVRLLDSKVLSGRMLVGGAAVWLAAVLALYTLLDWLVTGDVLIPRYSLALIAILAIPLARLSAAPLALEWNRHR